MRAAHAHVGFVVLAGLMVGALVAPAAEPPPKPATAAPADKKATTAAPADSKPTTAAPADKKPTTAAAARKNPLPGLLATLDKDVAERIATLADVAKSDDARVRARDDLITDRTLVARQSVNALISLGRIAGELPLEDDQKDNVRMHVAIALSRIRQRTEAEKVDYDLLAAWLDGKDADAALRHWAALAIANTRTPRALKLLDRILNAPDEGELITCLAVASSLGAWRKSNQALALPVLLGMLASKTPDVRTAGIEGLRVAALNTPDVVKPLARMAAEDADEPVWRAAERALNELSKGMPIRRLLIPVGATPAARKEVARVWLFIWERAKKKQAAKPKAG